MNLNFFGLKVGSGSGSAEETMNGSAATREVKPARAADGSDPTAAGSSPAISVGNSSMAALASGGISSAFGSLSSIAAGAYTATSVSTLLKENKAVMDGALASCMKCIEPTPELVVAFPLHKGDERSRLRHEPFHKEDNTMKGVRCGFCFRGEIVKLTIGAIVDSDGTPSIKIIIDHHRIPLAYNTFILPVGRQELPIPFLSIACPGVCVFGLVLVVHSRFLKRAEDLDAGSADRPNPLKLYADAEGVTPGMEKNTLDLHTYRFMGVSLGMCFEMADYFVGIVSTTMPDPLCTCLPQ